MKIALENVGDISEIFFEKNDVKNETIKNI